MRKNGKPITYNDLYNSGLYNPGLYAGQGIYETNLPTQNTLEEYKRATEQGNDQELNLNFISQLAWDPLDKFQHIQEFFSKNSKRSTGGVKKEGEFTLDDHIKFLTLLREREKRGEGKTDDASIKQRRKKEQSESESRASNKGKAKTRYEKALSVLNSEHQLISAVDLTNFNTKTLAGSKDKMYTSHQYTLADIATQFNNNRNHSVIPFTDTKIYPISVPLKSRDQADVNEAYHKISVFARDVLGQESEIMDAYMNALKYKSGDITGYQFDVNQPMTQNQPIHQLNSPPRSRTQSPTRQSPRSPTPTESFGGRTSRTPSPNRGLSTSRTTSPLRGASSPVNPNTQTVGGLGVFGGAPNFQGFQQGGTLPPFGGGQSQSQFGGPPSFA